MDEKREKGKAAVLRLVEASGARLHHSTFRRTLSRYGSPCVLCGWRGIPIPVIFREALITAKTTNRSCTTSVSSAASRSITPARLTRSWTRSPPENGYEPGQGLGRGLLRGGGVLDVRARARRPSLERVAAADA